MSDSFSRLLDETARSMATPLLIIIAADLDKWRIWAHEHDDVNAAAMIGVMIRHANAEIARRSPTKGT